MDNEIQHTIRPKGERLLSAGDKAEIVRDDGGTLSDGESWIGRKVLVNRVMEDGLPYDYQCRFEDTGELVWLDNFEVRKIE